MGRSSDKHVVIAGRREGVYVVRKRAAKGFSLAEAAVPRKAGAVPVAPRPKRASA